MEEEHYNSAKMLKDAIAKIDTVHGKTTLSGAAVQINVVKGDQTLVGHAELKSTLGDSAYNTICATALASVNTQLTSAKTTKQGQFEALGT